MRNSFAYLFFVAVVSVAGGGTANAATRSPASMPAVSTTTAGAVPGPWLVRAEVQLVGMNDNWLNLPLPEVGLTVGRDLTSWLSIELTGALREVDNERRRSWSALAAARWFIEGGINQRHALTVAAGPLVEVDNVVHGTVPFAHAELAYVYRSAFGLTVLAGAGPNVALASSSYVTPMSSPCGSGGDSPGFCVDLGPDARELHAGHASAHVRLAVGWRF